MQPQSSKPKPQTASTLASQVHKKPWFQHLIRNTQQRETLQTLFDRTLPPDMVGQYHVLEINKAVLFIGTDNAAWAARLRYATPHIIRELQPHPNFTGVQTLNCLVMPPVQETLVTSTITPIPESAAKSMIAIANTISDPDLKAAMLKLARNVEK